MTKNTITTVEGLAEMIQRTRASKEDIQEVTEDMKAIEGRLATQLDRIERVLREEQQRNIEHLDARTKTLEDALAV